MSAIDDPLAPTGNDPQEGVGLCLSGGGYRAMLFHVGAMWRFVDAGLLSRLTRVSSVSGGSITAAVLGLAWPKLSDGDVRAFDQHVVRPIRALASTTIDRPSIIGGLLLPGGVGDYVAKAYAKALFGSATLRDLPDEPRFVINATNLETSTLFRFSKRHASDWRVGQIANPAISIADAVAASSAFPPLLSPFVLDVHPSDFEPGGGDPSLDDDYRTQIALTDGGVYDNLGLETVWKRCATVFVSDGGGKIGDDSEPASEWIFQSKRIIDIILEQVGNLRKRQIVGSLADGERKGAYWGIRTNIADYGLSDTLPCPYETTIGIAEEPTRLKRIADDRQERIINWGYAVTDAALRRHFDSSLPAPTGFPYPAQGVG